MKTDAKVVPLPTKSRPVYNVEAEAAVLGTILLCNEALARVSFLRADHFYLEANRTIFGAMAAMISNGRVASVLTVVERLPSVQIPNGKTIEQYLDHLTIEATTIIAVAEYGEMIFELAARRRLIALGEDLISQSHDPQVELTIPDRIAEFARRLDDIRGTAGSAKDRPLLLSKENFIGDFSPPNYLIDGVLQRRYIYSLTGKTGHGKTAIALHVAKLIGSTVPNASLGPHGVDKGNVLYLAGENPDDLRMRVIGDDAASNHDGSKDRIHFIPGVIDIKNSFRDLERQAKQIGDIDLCIVDTSAAYSPVDDENSNAQMAAYARTLRELVNLPGGPCVIVLCHPVKNANEPAQLLPRGGGAYLAEMDGNLTVWQQDGLCELFWHGKIRGPGFEPMAFRLEKIKAPRLVDAKGLMISTVRAVPVSEQEQRVEAGAARTDEDRVLMAMLSNDRSVAKIAEACGWFSESGTPQKSKVARILDRLVKDGLVEKYRGEYRLTKSGSAAAEKAAQSSSPSGIP